MRLYVFALVIVCGALNGCKTTESSLQIETNLGTPPSKMLTPAYDVTARFSLTSHS